MATSGRFGLVHGDGEFVGSMKQKGRRWPAMPAPMMQTVCFSPLVSEDDGAGGRDEDIEVEILEMFLSMMRMF